MRRCRPSALAVVLVLGGCAIARPTPEPAPTGPAQPVVAPLAVERLRFVGPAQAPADHALATELAAFFAAQPVVERAYLVRARYGQDAQENLALALMAKGRVSDALLEQVGRVYASTHGTAGALDVIELDATQERALARSTPPFYGAPPP